jgi:AcrR family transcriptional regulator
MPTVSKPIRADARRNRLRVLDAARECFSRDGTEAQMDDVAAVAGVGVGTVYRHFATKDAIVRALIADYFEGQFEIVEAALRGEDPWEAFSGFLRSGAELMASSRALAQIASERPELMFEGALTIDAERGFFGMCQRLIDRAKDAGALRADFEFEDIPQIICSIGSLQVCPGAYASWRRLLEITLDGLRAPGRNHLPPGTGALSRPSRAICED